MKQRLYIQLFLTLVLWSVAGGWWSKALAQVRRVNQDGSNAALYDSGDTYIVDSQSGTYIDGAGNRTTWGRDTTRAGSEKKIPIGQFQWVLEPRLGT
ncbi:MAG: hypothetical protein IJT11_06525, partial [Bacteroidaceae bacterium]|nr:hypothetical protein [Bacteroidaceae bacterium]